MDIGWRHFRGLAVMAVGVYWIVKRDVPIGIEGRPPSFHAKGRWAVVLGTAVIIVGDRPRRRHHPHGRPAHGLQEDEDGASIVSSEAEGDAVGMDTNEA